MSAKGKVPVSKNQEFELVIDAVNDQGDGLGRYQGFAIMVPGLLAGEKALVHVVQVRAHFAYAKIVQVLVSSEDRVDPQCPLNGKCGGCQLGHMSYPAQLAYKHDKVAEKLIRTGHFSPEEVQSKLAPVTLGMNGDQWQHYRNKAQFPVQIINGKAEAGFYALHSHRLLPAYHCLLQSQTANRMIQDIMEEVRICRLSVYSEETGKGLLRHVLIRTSSDNKQVSALFVINGSTLPHQDKWAAFMEREGVTSFSVNINQANTNVILGRSSKLVYGNQYLTDRMDGLTFQISPESFYQVNPQQTQKLYQTALDFAAIKDSDTVWDAYCGIGTISLFLARRAKHVYGVEIVPAAIENAKMNAKANKIDNVTFYCGSAEKVMPEEYREHGVKADVVVVDPPRSGCDKALLDTLLDMKPDRIVYVSCDPATLSRDLDYLCHQEKSCYGLVKAQAVDMFSNTFHVETVVLLSKGEVGSKKIRVEFSLEDMDMSEFQDGATYTQIKDYVLEHSGLKVSNLYISQIKRKCGIEVGKNYNLPKSEDSRQPLCPPEKEKAIREAFKYFGII